MSVFTGRSRIDKDFEEANETVQTYTRRHQGIPYEIGERFDHIKGIKKRIEDLCLRAVRETFYLDPDYRENRARHEAEEIVYTYGPEWTKEYDTVQKDKELLSYIENDFPVILPWLEARIELIRMAERIRVGQKRKETRQEYYARTKQNIEADAELQKMILEQTVKQDREMRALLESHGVSEDAIKAIMNKVAANRSQTLTEGQEGGDDEATIFTAS